MTSVDRVLAWLATSLLLMGVAPACAHGSKRSAESAQGDEKLAVALKEADAMEREARELLDHGQRAEGAKRMQEACTARAEAWQAFERGGLAQASNAEEEDEAMAPRAVAVLRERANPGEEAEEDEETCEACLDAAVEELCARVEGLEQALADARSHMRKAEVVRLEDELASAREELERTQAELECACEACSDADAEATVEEEDALACPFLESNGNEVAQLREQLAGLQQEIASFRKELAAVAREMQRTSRRR